MLMKAKLLLLFMISLYLNGIYAENTSLQTINVKDKVSDERALMRNFVLDGKQWSVLLMPVVEPDNIYQTTEITYLEGDTLINDAFYSKTYQSSYEDKSQSQYIGAMREELSKIYLIRKGQENEEILYDYALEVGDTFGEGDEKATVTSVEYVPLGEYTYKKICFNNDKEAIWLESIGTFNGVLRNKPWMKIVGSLELLLCCSDNSGLLYQNEKYNECFIQNSATNINEDLATNCLNIENSNSGEIKFIFGKTDHLYNQIKLYDINGVLLKEQLLNKMGEVSFNNLKAGIYLYQIKGKENKDIRGKIIVK